MTLFSDILSIPSNPEDIFTLLSPIGHGAFGYVYKAIHNQSKEIYAIKIINYFKENINFLENKKHINNINFCYQTVQQETSLMKKVSSSNYILKYFGSYFSRKTNSLWLIIEYCSYGSTIDLMLAMNRIYTEIEVATIIKMVLQGLIIIHGKKLIHRDIKGANILLSEDGYAKLGDFGVGTKLLIKENYRSSIKGSPYWMSPQVIQKENYDSKTDIWSLGITCLELTEGEPPFSDLNPNEVMDFIGNKKFTFDDFFRRKKSYYSKEFINFIKKCLEINPEKRASAKELIKHEFIEKYAKNNIYLKNLLKKYEKNVDNYRKEFEENELKLKFGFDFNNNNYNCNNIFMNNNSKQIINKELNLNLNESFFNFSKIINNENDTNNNIHEIKKKNSKITKEIIYRKISPKNSKKLNNSLRINRTKNNLKANILNLNKSILRNNSFIISPKIKNKINKSRNINQEQNIFCSNNNTNNKCQRINFALSIKKSLNKDLLTNKTVYTKKIIINQGKQGKSLEKYSKLNSYKKIKTINSNINTDMNTNNTNTNNNSFMLNSTKKKINLKMKVINKMNINLEQFLDNKKTKLNLFENTDYNENIDESNDDDYIINKINNYTINKGVSLINKQSDININNANNNNNFDTIHSYSIIDSKDTFISIHSSRVNLNEQHKKYY